MPENSLPQIGKPYSTPDGFAMWRPQFTRLSVVACQGGLLELVVSCGDMPAISFQLDQAQREELASKLLAQAPASTAQPATESVAQGV